MSQALRMTCRAGALAAVPVALAGMGWPALAVVVVVALILVAAGCWVVADSGRARRLAMLIHAWRGTTASAINRARPAAAKQQQQVR
jgi:hypothetical protein